MVAEARMFTRLLLLSFAGIGFYYAHLLFGICADPFVFKALAVLFLMVTVPLPIIALNNKKLFPDLGATGKVMVNWIAVILFMHNFLMTFMFVLILKGTGTL